MLCLVLPSSRLMQYRFRPRRISTVVTTCESPASLPCWDREVWLASRSATKGKRQTFECYLAGSTASSHPWTTLVKQEHGVLCIWQKDVRGCRISTMGSVSQGVQDRPRSDGGDSACRWSLWRDVEQDNGSNVHNESFRAVLLRLCNGNQGEQQLVMRRLSLNNSKSRAHISLATQSWRH